MNYPPIIYITVAQVTSDEETKQKIKYIKENSLTYVYSIKISLWEKLKY